MSALTSLKLGTLFAVALGADGRPVATDATVLLDTTDRYRDTAIRPDGKVIYLGTDVAGNAMGADGTPTDVLEHPGMILELTPRE